MRSRGIQCEMIGRPGRDTQFPGSGETLEIAWRLARLIRRRGVTSVVSYTIQDLRATMIAKRLTRFRLCWRSWGDLTIFSKEKPPNPRAERLVREVRRQVDVVASTTQWEADTLVRWGVPPERIKVVYPGVDDDWFSAPGDRVRAESCRIIMSGRLVPWKGHQTFLRALAKVVESHPDVEAWIVGDGEADYRQLLEAEVVRLGIQKQTRFFGHRTDVHELVADCDIAIHCSEREPFGLVLIEAMACGVPMIAADVEGPREIIRQGDTGYLVPPHDADGFARALSDLVASSDRRREMGARGQRDVSARFRASVNVPEVERVIFGLASG